MRVLPILLLISGILLTNQGCPKQGDAAAPRRTVVVATPDVKSPFITQLVHEFERATTTFDLRVTEVGQESSMLEAVERGEADVALTGADHAYFAYREALQGGARLSNLRAMAALQVIPLHLLLRPGIRDISDLQGRNVGTNSVSRQLVKLLLAEFDLTPLQLHILPPDLALRRLGEGDLDGVFYPALSTPAIEAALRRGARLMPIEGSAVGRLRRAYPFVRFVSIPEATYGGQTVPVHTLGVALVYVCRRDLDEQLVYELTKLLFDVLPRLNAHSLPLHLVDVKEASATPIPLHEGSARYYREQELRP